MGDLSALAGEVWRAGGVAAASRRGEIKPVGCRMRLCRIEYPRTVGRALGTTARGRPGGSGAAGSVVA